MLLQLFTSIPRKSFLIPFVHSTNKWTHTCQLGLLPRLLCIDFLKVDVPTLDTITPLTPLTPSPLLGTLILHLLPSVPAWIRAGSAGRVSSGKRIRAKVPGGTRQSPLLSGNGAKGLEIGLCWAIGRIPFGLTDTKMGGSTECIHGWTYRRYFLNKCFGDGN